MRTAFAAPGAPAPIGPYSPGLKIGNLIFLSGQVALNSSGVLVGDDITTQTEQVMRNIEALLGAAGASFADVVRTTVFLSDLSEFTAMNAVYGGYMPDPPPTRSTVEVSRLPRDAKVEIDVIAVLA